LINSIKSDIKTPGECIDNVRDSKDIRMVDLRVWRRDGDEKKNQNIAQ